MTTTTSRRRRGRGRLAAIGMLVAGLALGGPVGASAADTGARYVAPWGADSNAGTIGAPWRTVTRGVRAIAAGQTLWIRGGTYDEDVSGTLNEGTASARITVRGYPGERAVIAGLVRLSDPDYWTIADLAFTWGGGTFDDHMVKVHGGTGWILERLDIYGSQSRAGLLIARSSTDGPPRDYVLRDSVVRDSANAANLYLNPGLDATNGLIERNLFFNSPTENAKIGWGGSDIGSHLDEYGAASIIFRYNTLYNAAQPLTIAEPAANVEVYRNLIVRGTRGYLVRLDGVEGHLGPGISIHDNLGAGANRWCEDFGAIPSCATATSATTFPRDPLFDSLTATGFHPGDPVAQAYGRWAGGGTSVPSPTPAPSQAPTPTPTPTPAPTTAASPTPTPAPSASSAPTQTASPEPTQSTAPTATPKVKPPPKGQDNGHGNKKPSPSPAP